jgi:type VI secretion system secreted protein VgrG
MWRLTLVEMFEIHQRLDLAGLIAKKLNLVQLLDGADYEIGLLSSYEPREFVFQYGESDFDFVARHAEHLGVSFIFEHRDVDRVVFVDTADGFPAASGDALEFGDSGHGHGVFSIEHVRTPIQRMYVSRDFNYRQPLEELHGEFELSAGFGGGRIEYGGHFKTKRGAARFAKIRAEEQLAKKDVYVCRSNAMRATAGSTFTISGHNTDLPKLLVTEVRHRMELTTHGGGDGTEIGYQNEFFAIDASLTYRPPRRTAIPRIDGVLTGIIESSPNRVERYALLDEQGRYSVRFAFDTAALGASEKPSHRIRMLQPHAGPGYGIHFPLKPGTEVFVAFSNGDPDRPIIVGAAPNPATLTPVTESEGTMNRIKTESGVLIEIQDGFGPRP